MRKSLYVAAAVFGGWLLLTKGCSLGT